MWTATPYADQRVPVPPGSVPHLPPKRPFRVVAGVDWSRDSLAAVREVAALYAIDDLTLVHALPLGGLRPRLCTERVKSRSHLSADSHRHESVAAARRDLAWVAALIQKKVGSTREVCRSGVPAGIMLDTARTVGAALIVVGQRGTREHLDRSMGSVSREICLEAACSTLVVRKPLGIAGRVLALIRQADDVALLQRWLRTFPFKEPTHLTVLCLIPGSQRGDPIGPLSVRFWRDAAMHNARSLLEPMVREIEGPSLRVTTRILQGDPSRIVLQEALNCDLFIVHGSDRKGRDPMRCGSPWRALLNLAPCSTLVLRGGEDGWT
ncbi:MAG TPA: universal stress protein [Nitrospiraceae bacterium]|nr:universal stress protein [Nitrospiraceae bacterium]